MAYETVIEPKKRLIQLNIKETLKYKDLILLLVKKDFVSLYKQTILGPLWAIIQPLFTTVIFTIIFGSLAKLTTADVAGGKEMVIPSFLFYMIGNISWQYFSSVISNTANTFITNSAVLGKVYFPRLVMPISSTISNLIAYGIQFVMFVVVWLFFIVKGGTDIQISGYIALIPLLILQMMMLGMGLGIIISSVTTKYRDLIHALSFGLTLWQYVSPVAYGLSLIPEKYLGIYMLNPMVSVITTFRYAFFGVGYFNLKYYLISWAVTLIMLFFGIILFNKVERTFMDTV